MTSNDGTGPTRHRQRTIMISAVTFLLGAATGIIGLTSVSTRQSALEAAPSLQSQRQDASEAAPALQDLISQRSPGDRTTSELTTTKRTTQVRLLSSRVPMTPPASAVPEPETWAMMLVGFGFIGWSMRRARSKSRERPENA